MQLKIRSQLSTPFNPLQLSNPPILLFVLSLFQLPLSWILLAKVRKIQFLYSCMVSSLPNHNIRQHLRPIFLMYSKEKQILRVNKHRFNPSFLNKTRSRLQIRHKPPFSLKEFQTSPRKDILLSISKLLSLLFSCQKRTNKDSHSQSFPILLLDLRAIIPLTHQQKTFLQSQPKNNSHQVCFNKSPISNTPERKTTILTKIIEKGKPKEEHRDSVPFMQIE